MKYYFSHRSRASPYARGLSTSKPPHKGSFHFQPPHGEPFHFSLPCARGGGFCRAKLGGVVRKTIPLASLREASPLAALIRDAHMGDFFILRPPLCKGKCQRS